MQLYQLFRQAKLTPRQAEVAVLVANGYGNASIADRLCIAEGSVKCHLTSIYLRLGVKSRLQLAVWCLRKYYS